VRNIALLTAGRFSRCDMVATVIPLRPPMVLIVLYYDVTGKADDRKLHSRTHAMQLDPVTGGSSGLEEPRSILSKVALQLLG